MSEALYITVTDDAPEGEIGKWKRADVRLNGRIVATGFAPSRDPYIDGTDVTSAVTLAQGQFVREILGADIRVEKQPEASNGRLYEVLITRKADSGN